MIFIHHPAHKCWYAITNAMYQRAQEVGYAQAFEEATLLGDFFAVAA